VVRLTSVRHAHNGATLQQCCQTATAIRFGSGREGRLPSVQVLQRVATERVHHTRLDIEPGLLAPAPLGGDERSRRVRSGMEVLEDHPNDPQHHDAEGRKLFV